jgi:hypothetical protein
VRGGLDDALDKLARRDELRRRAAGEATGTPPAVTELVEAIAGVIAHNPQLGVTVGVEGAGDPLLLHFYFADGQVQVNAENAVAAPAGEHSATGRRHADFVVAVDATVDESYPAPAPPGYEERFYSESETAERRYGTFDNPPAAPPPQHEDAPDLGARMRDLGMATSRPEAYAMPPQPPSPVPPEAGSAQATRRIRPEQYRAPAEPPAAERIPQQPRPNGMPAHQPNGMPAPLPHPIPLQVERPEETEMAARRLAALLRDNPTLLRPASPD